MRGPGRREIGHGALGERALEPVIPSEKISLTLSVLYQKCLNQTALRLKQVFAQAHLQ